MNESINTLRAALPKILGRGKFYSLKPLCLNTKAKLLLGIHSHLKNHMGLGGPFISPQIPGR